MLKDILVLPAAAIAGAALAYVVWVLLGRPRQP